MNPNTQRLIEREISRSIRETLERMGRRKLPLFPSHATVYMMAKAAGAVYEAAVKAAEREQTE